MKEQEASTLASEEHHEATKEAIHESSENARSRWDAAPGSETTVELDGERTTEVIPESTTPLEPQQFAGYLSTLPQTRDMRVEVIVTTPDGRRFVTEESQEYELDDNGDVKNYEFEDVYSLVERVCERANAALP